MLSVQVQTLPFASGAPMLSFATISVQLAQIIQKEKIMFCCKSLHELEESKVWIWTTMDGGFHGLHTEVLAPLFGEIRSAYSSPSSCHLVCKGQHRHPCKYISAWIRSLWANLRELSSRGILLQNLSTPVQESADQGFIRLAARPFLISVITWIVQRNSATCLTRRNCVEHGRSRMFLFRKGVLPKNKTKKVLHDQMKPPL